MEIGKSKHRVGKCMCVIFVLYTTYLHKWERYATTLNNGYSFKTE